MWVGTQPICHLLVAHPNSCFPFPNSLVSSSMASHFLWLLPARPFTPDLNCIYSGCNPPPKNKKHLRSSFHVTLEPFLFFHRFFHPQKPSSALAQWQVYHPEGIGQRGLSQFVGFSDLGSGRVWLSTGSLWCVRF